MKTHETNTDSSTTTATNLIFNLSSMFESSDTKLGGATRLKVGSIPQFAVYRHEDSTILTIQLYRFYSFYKFGSENVISRIRSKIMEITCAVMLIQ